MEDTHLQLRDKKESGKMEDERTQFMRNSRAEWEAPRRLDEGQRGEFTEHRLCTRSHGRQLMQVLSLNLFTLGEWSSWEAG